MGSHYHGQNFDSTVAKKSVTQKLLQSKNSLPGMVSSEQYFPKFFEPNVDQGLSKSSYLQIVVFLVDQSNSAC